mgnify:CR=1 FL=1
MKRLLKTAIAAAAGLLVAGAVSATTIAGGLTPGVLNTIEDQDREAYVDVDADGRISVGDVFFGFVRIDNFLPKGVSTNKVYGIISNQITGADPYGLGTNNILTLGTTTAAGLTLDALTGDANTAGGLVAVYDSAVDFADLINAPPGGATTMFDYINYIVANGTLRLVGGFDPAGDPDNYLHVQNILSLSLNSLNAPLATLSTSVSINSFVGGLSVLYNNTPFVYDDAVVTTDFTGLNSYTNQIGIGNGASRGMVGEGNEAIWANAGAGFAQCTTATGAAASCGVVTDADFFVQPRRAVPEPASLALLGASFIGLIGAGQLARRSRRRD